MKKELIGASLVALVLLSVVEVVSVTAQSDVLKPVDAQSASTAVDTRLTASLDPTAVTYEQNFAIRGQLSNAAGPIANRQVELQQWAPTLISLTKTATDGNGKYQFILDVKSTTDFPSTSVNLYQVAFAGDNGLPATTSNIVGVTIMPLKLTFTPLNQVAYTGQDFQVSGQLTNPITGAPLANRQITLQEGGGRPTNDYIDVATTRTNTAGTYQFTLTQIQQNFAIPETGLYRTVTPGVNGYPVGDNGIRPGAGAITIKSATAPSSIDVAPMTVVYGQNFIVSGHLANETGVPIANRDITLQRWTETYGVCETVSSGRTDVNGNYQFTLSEHASNDYAYYVLFPGDATFTRTVSPSINQVVLPFTFTTSPLHQIVAVGSSFIISGTLKNPVTGTSVPNAKIALQRWDKEIRDGSTDINGNYQFTLSEGSATVVGYQVVFPGDGESWWEHASNNVVGVTVLPAQPLTTSFTYSPAHPLRLDLITFDASSSKAPGGYIAKYSWDFGDPSSAVNKVDTSATRVTHFYQKGGTYTVKLIITDNKGATATTSQTVTVDSKSYYDLHPEQALRIMWFLKNVPPLFLPPGPNQLYRYSWQLMEWLMMIRANMK